MNESIGVYIHVPYCRVLCPYCDFVKQRLGNTDTAPFVDALCREIAEFSGPDDVGSIFFGGGTPSLLRPEALEKIMTTLQSRFTLSAPEVSIEVNPDDVTDANLRAWLAMGITRVSLGVQSFDDATLLYLGRCHDATAARSACEQVAHHFENWGLDLIFGAFPDEEWTSRGQVSFERDLDVCIEFLPPHLSLYGLTFEENTAFWNRRGEALDEDRSLELYRSAIDRLSAYEHYEVSNFAREGFRSRHNQIYWRNGEYAGFGPGSVSYIDGVRSRNDTGINHYMASPGAKPEVQKLSPNEIKVETLIQYFRTRAGLSKKEYARRFGSEVGTDFAEALTQLVDRGLLEDTGEVLRPTTRGFNLNNEIGLALVDQG